jgi:hypothetical protein
MPSYSNPNVVNYSFSVNMFTGAIEGTAATSSYQIRPYPNCTGVLRDVQLSLGTVWSNTTTTGCTFSVGSTAGTSSYMCTWTPLAAAGSCAAGTVYRAYDTTPTTAVGIQKDVFIPGASNTPIYVNLNTGTGTATPGVAGSGVGVVNVLIEWS